MLFYELVEGGAQAEACHKAGAAPVANGLLYSPEEAEAANGHGGGGGGGVIGPNPGMYGPQMPSSSSVIGPAIGPQMPPGVAIGPQIGPQMPPLRPQIGAAAAPAYRSLSSGAEPDPAGIIGPALPPAKQLSAHEAAAAELAAERAAEEGGWGGWSDAAAPSTPPQVGPQIGLQVGPQVGPQVGRKIGRKMGRDGARSGSRRTSRSVSCGEPPGWCAADSSLSASMARNLDRNKPDMAGQRGPSG